MPRKKFIEEKLKSVDAEVGDIIKITRKNDENEGVLMPHHEFSDDDILTAQKLMAAKGGVFGEPASAASLAGLIKLSHSGMDFSLKRVVCVVTGTGLKDTDTALRDANSFLELPADLVAVEQALGMD